MGDRHSVRRACLCAHARQLRGPRTSFSALARLRSMLPLLEPVSLLLESSSELWCRRFLAFDLCCAPVRQALDTQLAAQWGDARVMLVRVLALLVVLPHSVCGGSTLELTLPRHFRRSAHPPASHGRCTRPGRGHHACVAPHHARRALLQHSSPEVCTACGCAPVAAWRSIPGCGPPSRARGYSRQSL